MKAYIYGRYSDHRQNDASIEQQFREIRDYCASHDLQIVGEYADRAVSGKTDARPEFQRMIRDCAKGKVGYVVCWKVDRFARNRYDSAMYKARLKKCGVRVVYAKESIPDGPEGILLESVLEGSAEYYSANLSQNIRRGMTENALQCKVNNGSLPLGYCKGVDGKYAIEPAAAALVRDIFQMYTSGMKISEITADLNGRGQRTAHGAKFNKNSLRTLLRNERYIGVYQYGEIRIEDGIPPIISKEVFLLAQETIRKNAKAPASSWSDVDYLLTGKLFCGLCGSSMTGVSGTSHTGAKHNYYACSAQKRQKSCAKKAVRKDFIEELVARETALLVLTDSMIAKIAQAAVDLQKQEQGNSPIPRLQRQLADVLKKLNNVASAISQGIVTATTKQMLLDFEAQKAELESAIESERVELTGITREQLIFWLEKFRGGDCKSPKYQEQIIEAFVSAVYLFDDKIRIVYQYSKDEKDTVDLAFIESLDGGGDGFALAVPASTTRNA
ncbi:MAG: recombinase family protein [Oscillospiraceae bacterium]|nr:recombinase family protein [Oscillospiraceae bacterium]